MIKTWLHRIRDWADKVSPANVLVASCMLGAIAITALAISTLSYRTSDATSTRQLAVEEAQKAEANSNAVSRCELYDWSRPGVGSPATTPKGIEKEETATMRYAFLHCDGVLKSASTNPYSGPIFLPTAPAGTPSAIATPRR